METRVDDITGESRRLTTEKLVDDLKAMFQRAEEKAVERAKAMATEHHVELWEPESPRRIARFEPARMRTAN